MVCQCQTIKKKDLGRTGKHVKKPYKIDLDFKGQSYTGNMNVLNTSSHGDKSICQICHTKKSFGPDTNLHRQKDGQADGRTDRQTVIPKYPLNYVHGGYNNKRPIAIGHITHLSNSAS